MQDTQAAGTSLTVRELACRDRIHMLLAALSLLHERLHSAGDTPRCQVIEMAITQLVKTFRAALADNALQGPAAASPDAGQAVAWQQVRLSAAKLLRL